MSYPVKWNLYNVFRDYIQNFYDAIGPDNFINRFKYSYIEEAEELKMSSDTTFDRIGCSVQMESANWLIKVCENKDSIGGRKASMLSYRLFNRKDDGYTRLTISHVNDKDATQVDDAKMNFFYPENPLLGMKIAQGKNYAVYHRSTIPIAFGIL